MAKHFAMESAVFYSQVVLTNRPGIPRQSFPLFLKKQHATFDRCLLLAVQFNRSGKIFPFDF